MRNSMLALTLVWGVLDASSARAQTVQVQEAQPPDTSQTVDENSPDESQQRLFSGVEMWRLDPFRFRSDLSFEVPASSLSDANEQLELSVSIGLTRHLQLSVAEQVGQLSGSDTSIQQVDSPISIRYSLGDHYGELAGNPAVELSWHPRHGSPDRIGGRLILNGEITGNIEGALNLYVEQNVERMTRHYVDGTLGATAGVSYRVIDQHLRIGFEGRMGMAQPDDSLYQPDIAVGPVVMATIGPVSATTCMRLNLSAPQVKLEPSATLSYLF